MSNAAPEDDKPWHCGLCGQTSPECRCGDPLFMVIRIPDFTADLDEHTAAAREMVGMINAQRYENWVCGGGDPDDVKEVRLVASGWRTPEDAPMSDQATFTLDLGAGMKPYVIESSDMMTDGSAIVRFAPMDSAAPKVNPDRIVMPGTETNTRCALRAHAEGIPASLNHETGVWTIEPRTQEEWATWRRIVASLAPAPEDDDA